MELTSLFRGGEVIDSTSNKIRIHGDEAVDANGVPVFNHANPVEWLYMRAHYEKRK